MLRDRLCAIRILDACGGAGQFITGRIAYSQEILAELQLPIPVS